MKIDNMQCLVPRPPCDLKAGLFSRLTRGSYSAIALKMHVSRIADVLVARASSAGTFINRSSSVMPAFLPSTLSTKRRGMRAHKTSIDAAIPLIALKVNAVSARVVLVKRFDHQAAQDMPGVPTCSAPPANDEHPRTPPGPSMVHFNRSSRLSRPRLRGLPSTACPLPRGRRFP